jgi:hypothetical protein
MFLSIMIKLYWYILVQSTRLVKKIVKTLILLRSFTALFLYKRERGREKVTIMDNKRIIVKGILN